MDWIRLEDPLTGSNCYVLREGTDCVVIDPNRDEVGEWIQIQGLRPSHILLTHEHCDHMAGLEALRACWPDTPVICTAACSAGLQNTRLNMTCMMEVYLTFQGKPGVHYPPFICRPAEQTFSQPYTFRWQSHTLECIPPSRAHSRQHGNCPGREHFFLRGLPHSRNAGHPAASRRQRGGLPAVHRTGADGASGGNEDLSRTRIALFPAEEGGGT